MANASESDNINYIIDERSFISLLIDLYRETPELWKVKHQDYCDKVKRALAVEKIVNELRVYKQDFTEEQFKKKINILRTNFNKMRRKIDAAAANGIEDFKQNLWYFNEMLFLTEQDNASNFERRLSNANSEKAELSDNCDQKYFMESDFQSETPQRIRKKVFKKKVAIKRPRIELEHTENTDNEEPEPYMTVTTTYYKKPKTKEDVLAKAWAVKLKKLAPEQRLFAEKIINDVLFEGELGNLTKNGVSFCPAF